LISAHALLNETDSPSDEEIRHALAGNLRRCTGYAKIVKDVQRAAADVRSAKSVISDGPDD